VHIVEELCRVLGSVIIDNEEFILLEYIMNTGDKTQQQWQPYLLLSVGTRQSQRLFLTFSQVKALWSQRTSPPGCCVNKAQFASE
jgi:hypothetical protein